MPDRNTKVLAEGFGFLEGPRWRDGVLWMSDIATGEVVTLTPDGTKATIVEVPGRPSGLGFLPDGTPIVVSMAGRTLQRIENGGLTPHADLTTAAPSMINDMVVDSAGRAYVGSIGYNLLEGEEPKPGAIVLADADGKVRVVAEDLTFPNGSVITKDGRLVVGETFANRLTSYSIQEDGSLTDHKIEAALDDTPDGICLDIEGGIWVATVRGERFIRVLGGRVVEEVATPGRLAIACQLGGPDGRTLFCLTYKGELEEMGEQRTSRVETMTVEAPGAGSP